MSQVKDAYRLTAPCVDCPFRSDKPFPLRHGRAREIVQGLRGGGEFHCHKTTRQTGSGNQAFCGGALILLEKTEGANQMMRIAETLGAYNPDLLDMDALVYDTFAAFVKGVSTRMGDYPVETSDAQYCEVAEHGCQNPSGWGHGSTVMENDEPPSCTDECRECGSYMCDACRSTSTLCSICDGDEQ